MLSVFGYGGSMPPSSSRGRATGLVAALALSAGACGGSPAEDPEATVRSAIHSALTSRDPATCSRAFTRGYVEQTQLTEGPAALRVCQETLRLGLPARDTAISQVSVTGSRARARVGLQGGDEDGSTYDLRLVRRDGDWKLDRIAGVELEFERYLRAGRRQLVRPPAALRAKEAACVVDHIRRLGESRLERAIVAADASVVSGGLLPCVGTRSLRRQFEEGIRIGLAGQADGDCVIARLRDSVSEQDIRTFMAATLEGNELPPELTQIVARAVLACPIGGGSGQSQAA
jgi:hypothetical protein